MTKKIDIKRVLIFSLSMSAIIILLYHLFAFISNIYIFYRHYYIEKASLMNNCPEQLIITNLKHFKKKYIFDILEVNLSKELVLNKNVSGTSIGKIKYVNYNIGSNKIFYLPTKDIKFKTNDIMNNYYL